MNKTMNKTKMQTFSVCKLTVTALFGLAVTLVSCSNEEIVQNQKTAIENGKDLTTFETGEPESSNAKTRTSLDYASGAFYWEAGDKIYVKDDDGVLQKSTNAPTSKVAAFKYKVPGKFTGNSYKVYYLGKNSNGSQVRISTAQTQTKPDNTEHFGTAGDYGTATATKVPNKQQFAFELEHQPAYLVFQPYTSNTILQNCYLTKVEVTSDNDIAETYTVNTSTDNLDASAVTDSKKIILTTSGSSSNPNGFPLTNSAASVTTNGAYMVIKPGTHTLKVRYWIKDLVTQVEGTITKTLPATAYASNTYYDMTANLNVRNYDGNNYYMWDAEQPYWYGHEWDKAGYVAGTDQPTVYRQRGSAYPQDNSDSRWCNERSFNDGTRGDAQTALFQTLPNINEMFWYAMKGDPRWDDDQLWTTMGHLYKGGMWFKKKAEISGFTPNNAPDGNDYRSRFGFNGFDTTSPSILSGVPTAADADKYFYLPALGYYQSGRLQDLGTDLGNAGAYWSSSATPWTSSNEAFHLYFGRGEVIVSYNSRENGISVQAFK